MDISTSDVRRARYKQPSPIPGIECVNAILGEHKLEKIVLVPLFLFLSDQIILPVPNIHPC